MPETETKDSKTKPMGKEKLRTIMEAASALTALGDEESSESRPGSPSPKNEPKSDEPVKPKEAPEAPKEPAKRYIPDHKKPDAALTFPEKLMNLMQYADKCPEGFCIAWLPDGKSFVIRNPDEFTRNVLPKFFKATKFSSFTRKLYRWGFRQVNRGIGPDDPIIFGNEHFQRDDAEAMTKMRSVTAASTRKAEQHRAAMYGAKRPLDVPFDDRDHKRMLFDQLLQQKAAMMGHQGMYTGYPQNQNVSLANTLHSSIASSMPFNPNPGMPKMMNQGPMNGFVPQAPNTSHQYPNASTAEIVNAAINALRFAS